MLYGLSSDEDLTTLHYVACTLVRLGMEEQCHARMIQEGAARYCIQYIEPEITKYMGHGKG